LPTILRSEGDEEIDELPSLMVAFHCFNQCLALALAAIDDRDTAYSWVHACTYAMIRSILGVLARVPVDSKAKVVLLIYACIWLVIFRRMGTTSPTGSPSIAAI